jgi:hypothetical protein
MKNEKMPNKCGENVKGKINRLKTRLQEMCKFYKVSLRLILNGLLMAIKVKNMKNFMR